MKIEFDASDFNGFAADLTNRIAQQPNMVRNVVRKTAKDIEKTAKQLAPVDTGNLRSSIKTSDLRSTTSNSPEAEVRASASYAQYLELGTSRMAPQSFMRPAADRHAPAFQQAMQQIIGKSLG